MQGKAQEASRALKGALPGGSQMWDTWSRPYIERIVRKVKAEHPGTPVTVYANGSGGLIERLGATGADVVGLDWSVDMADARRRLGPGVAVQVGAAAPDLAAL